VQDLDDIQQQLELKTQEVETLTNTVEEERKRSVQWQKINIIYTQEKEDLETDMEQKVTEISRLCREMENLKSSAEQRVEAVRLEADQLEKDLTEQRELVTRLSEDKESSVEDRNKLRDFEMKLEDKDGMIEKLTASIAELKHEQQSKFRK